MQEEYRGHTEEEWYVGQRAVMSVVWRRRGLRQIQSVASGPTSTFSPKGSTELRRHWSVKSWGHAMRGAAALVNG